MLAASMAQGGNQLPSNMRHLDALLKDVKTIHLGTGLSGGCSAAAAPQAQLKRDTCYYRTYSNRRSIILRHRSFRIPPLPLQHLKRIGTQLEVPAADKYLKLAIDGSD